MPEEDSLSPRTVRLPDAVIPRGSESMLEAVKLFPPGNLLDVGIGAARRALFFVETENFKYVFPSFRIEFKTVDINEGQKRGKRRAFEIPDKLYTGRAGIMPRTKDKSRSGGRISDLRGGSICVVSDKAVRISGCRKIEEYSSVRVRLRLCDNIVEVRGHFLTVSTFCREDIEVSGRIKALVFVGETDEGGAEH